MHKILQLLTKYAKPNDIVYSNAPTNAPPVQLSQPTGAPNPFGASYVQEPPLQSNSEPSRGEALTNSNAPTNAPPVQLSQPTGAPNGFGQNTLSVHDSGPTSNGPWWNCTKTDSTKYYYTVSDIKSSCGRSNLFVMRTILGSETLVLQKFHQPKPAQNVSAPPVPSTQPLESARDPNLIGGNTFDARNSMTRKQSL